MISMPSVCTYSGGKINGFIASGIKLSKKPTIPLLSPPGIMEKVLKCQWHGSSTSSEKILTYGSKSFLKATTGHPTYSQRLWNIYKLISDYTAYSQILSPQLANLGHIIKYIYKEILSQKIQVLSHWEYLALQPALEQTSLSSTMLSIFEMQFKIQNYAMLLKKLSSQYGSTCLNRVESSSISAPSGIETTYHTHLLQWTHTIQYFTRFLKTVLNPSGRTSGLNMHYGNAATRLAKESLIGRLGTSRYPPKICYSKKNLLELALSTPSRPTDCVSLAGSISQQAKAKKPNTTFSFLLGSTDKEENGAKKF